LPGSPPLIEGVIELRGTLIPVVDLGRALGEAPIGETARGRIVISQIGGLVIGLVVQRATDVVTVEASDLCRPVETSSPNSGEVIQAIARRKGADPIVVLSLESLLRLVRDSESSTREASA
jgi:purine-binding chemotaxis protein CheW